MNLFIVVLENQDAEHRLFYVGTTRAKENLYIMQPSSDYYYTIGEPIVWATYIKNK